MLLHICPRLYSPYKNVALVEMTLKPLGLRLRGNVELRCGRPYRNKEYAVACRRHKTRKAFIGILIDTSHHISEFDYAATWVVDAEFKVSHHVHYIILDKDFDAASDNMVLWYGTAKESGNWSNRVPDWAREVSPVRGQPIAAITPSQGLGREARQDKLDHNGRITLRQETFCMPTIEKERIITSESSFRGEKYPPLAHAFSVST
jgi:Family of unknown function (DUF6012)